MAAVLTMHRTVSSGAPSRTVATMSLDVEALYRRYGDMVLGRCMSLLRNEADAREACQEVFLKVHRASDRFRGEASPSTFLYKITTNHCLNVIRSRKRRPETPVDDLTYVPDSVVVDKVELRQLLDHLLTGEDERTMECVIYYYVDGMTHRAIGDMTGVTEAAVRKRLKKFQARAKEKAGWSS